jgi:glyoxylase-like metal-dependent hydrolase (beta-lactamase superfamily II)
MINLFSKFNSPVKIQCFSRPTGIMRGIFPVIGMVSTGDFDLEVLDGLGGHTFGQVYLYSKMLGLLFTADSVINFSSLSEKRAEYNSLAAFLVTSVNVDSDLAKRERMALLDLADETGKTLSGSDRKCLICGGHGAVSVLEGGRLVTYGEIEKYQV